MPVPASNANRIRYCPDAVSMMRFNWSSVKYGCLGLVGLPNDSSHVSHTLRPTTSLITPMMFAMVLRLSM